MRHFLIVFDRGRGSLVQLQPFEDRAAAFEARFAAERAHRSNSAIEVVVLSADSEQALRRTHARYFETVAEMTADALRAMGDGRGVA